MLDTLPPTRKKIACLIAEFADPPADLELMFENDRLDDMGYDSLARVELAMEIEDEFNIALADDILDKAQTVGDVLKLVAEHIH